MYKIDFRKRQDDVIGELISMDGVDFYFATEDHEKGWVVLSSGDKSAEYPILLIDMPRG